MPLSPRFLEVSTWARGGVRGETSDYLDILREVDLQPLVKALIWPEPEVDPDKLGTKGWSSASLDYMTAALERRRS
jgi:hypothetical protein